MKLSRFKHLLLAFLLCTSFTACTEKRRSVVVLIELDASGSMAVKNAEMVKSIDEIASRLQNGDALLLTAFTNNAANARPLQKFVFDDGGLLASGDVQKPAARKKFLETVHAAAESLVQEPNVEIRRRKGNGALAGLDQVADKGTDVFGAFERAATILGSGEFKGYDRRLILESDMIHQAQDADLLTVRLGEKDRSKLIKSRDHAFGNPSLAGIKIWALCTSKYPGRNLDPRRLAEIQHLWREFVTDRGGEFPADHYGELLGW